MCASARSDAHAATTTLLISFSTMRVEKKARRLAEQRLRCQRPGLSGVEHVPQLDAPIEASAARQGNKGRAKHPAPAARPVSNSLRLAKPLLQRPDDCVTPCALSTVHNYSIVFLTVSKKSLCHFSLGTSRTLRPAPRSRTAIGVGGLPESDGRTQDLERDVEIAGAAAAKRPASSKSTR